MVQINKVMPISSVCIKEAKVKESDLLISDYFPAVSLPLTLTEVFFLLSTSFGHNQR